MFKKLNSSPQIKSWQYEEKAGFCYFVLEEEDLIKIIFNLMPLFIKSHYLLKIKNFFLLSLRGIFVWPMVSHELQTHVQVCMCKL